MFEYNYLNDLWHSEVCSIRSSPFLLGWLKENGNGVFDSRKLSDGRALSAEIIFKQLKVSISNNLDVNNPSSITRNLPEDLEKLIK